MEVFDHTQWSSTCPLLVAVLTETWPYRPGDLSSGVRMRFVSNLLDLSYLLCGCVVQRVRKGRGPPPPMIVDGEERQMTNMLHRLIGSVAWRLQLVLWMDLPLRQFLGTRSVLACLSDFGGTCTTSVLVFTLVMERGSLKTDGGVPAELPGRFSYQDGYN